MKKSLILGLSTIAMVTASFSAVADMHKSSSQWYVGVGGSWISTNEVNRASLETDSDTPDVDVEATPQTKKLRMQDSTGWGGNFLVGHKFHFNNWDMFGEFGYGIDSSQAQAKKTYYHELVVPGDPQESTDFSVSLRRNHTLSFGLGASKDINDTMAAFFKLSALFTQFELDAKVGGIVDTGDTGHSVKKVWKWGLAPTVGIAKDLGSDFTIKADYSYQMYGQIKEGMAISQSSTADSTSKIKPRYHVVGLTLTKAF